MSGKGKGKGVIRHNRKPAKENIQGITKPAIRRLARRGGVKRLNGLIYEETREVLKTYLKDILRSAVIYSQGRKLPAPKTVTTQDVLNALRLHNRPLYGYDLQK